MVSIELVLHLILPLLFQKNLSVNIRILIIETHDGIFEGELELYVHNVKDLNNLIMNISKIKGVDSVKRNEELAK